MYSMFLVFCIAAVIFSPLLLDIGLTLYENRVERRRRAADTAEPQRSPLNLA